MKKKSIKKESNKKEDIKKVNIKKIDIEKENTEKENPKKVSPKKESPKKNRTGLYIVFGLIFIMVFSAFISNLTTKEEKEVFNNVTYQEYKDLYKSDELEFVFVGRPGCGYCQMVKPLLEEIQDEEKMVWNYLNTDIMTQADFNDIKNTAAVFAGEWGTPTLLALKDGKVLNVISGYKEKQILKSFVKSSKEGKEWKETAE